MKKRGFLPDEIIFSVTTSCNLHCGHCFVNRSPVNLDADGAEKFLASCRGSAIEKIGFTGGEPFLNLDFICRLSEFAVENDFYFDQIITNGDWWKNEEDLNQKLQRLYDSGYDGKISISFDTFHRQNVERTGLFIKKAGEYFGGQSLSIQSVISPADYDDYKESLQKLSENISALMEDFTHKKSHLGLINLVSDSLFVPVYIQPQTFQSSQAQAWTSPRWFKDDFCQGPGNILFIHADGNIAPCCGFANENPELFIGKITDTYEKVMENAGKNKLVQLCYNEGLMHFKKHKLNKILKAKGKKLPKGKCGEICSFCDFVCQLGDL